MIEHEIISIQNICFFDVAIDVINDYFDVANKINKNEISIIDFDWLINNVNINVNLFHENVTNIIKIAFDIIFANSFVVNLTNFVFDVKKY